MDIKEIAKNTKNAFLKVMNFDNSIKNKALENIVKKLKNYKEEIFETNKKDLEEAKKLLDDN